MRCPRCNDNYGEEDCIRCFACSSAFHPECYQIAPNIVDEVKLGHIWKCPKCRDVHKNVASMFCQESSEEMLSKSLSACSFDSSILSRSINKSRSTQSFDGFTIYNAKKVDSNCSLDGAVSLSQDNGALIEAQMNQIEQLRVTIITLTQSVNSLSKIVSDLSHKISSTSGDKL